MWRLIQRAAVSVCLAAICGSAVIHAEPFGDPIASPENPSPGAHKKLLYNSDFTYLDDAPQLGTDLGLTSVERR